MIRIQFPPAASASSRPRAILSKQFLASGKTTNLTVLAANEPKFAAAIGLLALQRSRLRTRFAIVFVWHEEHASLMATAVRQPDQIGPRTQSGAAESYWKKGRAAGI